MDINRESILALAQPLEGGGAGEDPGYLDEFDKIEDELQKGEGINRSQIDWDNIIKWSVELLSTQTKSLDTYCHLCLALYHKHGFEGASYGLEALSEVVNSELWESVHPRSKKLVAQAKLRARSLTWLGSKLDKIISAYELNADSPHETFLLFQKQFDACEGAYAQQLEDSAPDVFALKGNLRRLAEEAKHWLEEKSKQAVEEQEAQRQREEEEAAAKVAQEAQQAVPETPKQSAPTQAVATAQVAVAPSVSVSSDGIEKSLTNLAKGFDDVSAFYGAQNQYEPSAFYFARLAKWLQLTQIPASGVMPQIPQEPIVLRLKELEQNKDYATLVTEAENIFRSGAMFCLSVQRFVYRGLMGLDKEDTAATVLRCTQDFVARFPDMLSREFNDGSPFVDSQTTLWLQQGNQSGASSGEGVVDSIAAAYQEAEMAIANGKPEEAVKLLEDELANATTPQDCTKVRFYIGKMFYVLERHDVAASVLNAIRHEMFELSASNFDTNLSNDTANLLLKCYNKVKLQDKLDKSQEVEYQQLQKEVFGRTPSLAFEINEL